MRITRLVKEMPHGRYAKIVPLNSGAKVKKYITAATGLPGRPKKVLRVRPAIGGVPLRVSVLHLNPAANSLSRLLFRVGVPVMRNPAGIVRHTTATAATGRNVLIDRTGTGARDQTVPTDQIGTKTLTGVTDRIGGDRIDSAKIIAQATGRLTAIAAEQRVVMQPGASTGLHQQVIGTGSLSLLNLTDRSLSVRKTAGAINLLVISQAIKTNGRVAIRIGPALMAVTGREVLLIGLAPVVLTGITKTGQLVLTTVLTPISQSGRNQVRNARSGQIALLMTAGRPAEIPGRLIVRDPEMTVGRREVPNVSFR